MTQDKTNTDFFEALALEYQELEAKLNATPAPEEAEGITARMTAIRAEVAGRLRQDIDALAGKVQTPDRIASDEQALQHRFLQAAAHAIVVRELIHGREIMRVGHMLEEVPPCLIVNPDRLSPDDRELLVEEVRSRRDKIQGIPSILERRETVELIEEKIAAGRALSDDALFQRFMDDRAAGPGGGGKKEGFKAIVARRVLAAQAHRSSQELAESLPRCAESLRRLQEQRADDANIGPIQ